MAEMSDSTRATSVAVVLAIVLAGPAAFAQTAPTRKSAPAKAAAAKTAVAVYKTPTCGCCGKWVEHMQASGFATTVTELPDLAETKAKHGVPAKLQSCHTSLVGGYVIEGHVPAEDIRRLLREKPAIVGLAAPGMPAGSPGMDVPHAPAFDVIAFDKDGHTKVFASHPAR
jgi:hypothetical protein